MSLRSLSALSLSRAFAKMSVWFFVFAFVAALARFPAISVGLLVSALLMLFAKSIALGEHVRGEGNANSDSYERRRRRERRGALLAAIFFTLTILLLNLLISVARAGLA